MRFLLVGIAILCATSSAAAQVPLSVSVADARIGVGQHISSVSLEGYAGRGLPKQDQWPWQLGLGTALGFVGGGVGGYTAVALSSSDDGWAELGAAVLGAAIGYTVGVAVGVKYAGDTDEVKGRMWVTYGGAVAGLFVGGGLASLTENGGLAGGLFVAGSVGTAMLGHYVSRRYVVDPASPGDELGHVRVRALQPTLLAVQTDRGRRAVAGVEVIRLQF